MKNHRSILKMAALLTVMIAAADIRVALAQTDQQTDHTVAHTPDGATLFVASPTSNLRNVIRATDGTITDGTVISVASDEDMTQSLSISAEPAGRFVEEDSAFGLGTITLDTVTGFRWLDLTVTEPFTYNEVISKLGPGGMFEGYRLGLDVEVKEVMNAFGILGDLPAQPVHDEFRHFFGITDYQDEWPETFGYASPLVDGMAPVFGLDFFYSNGSSMMYWGYTGNLLHNPDINFKGFGTWLRVIAPAPCDVVAYVVHDGGLNDSLLLSVSNPNLQFTPLGTVHNGYDLEALALDPQTGELYASSGENSNKPGYLYKVQEKNVVELGQPGAFAGGLEGLSFNPSTNILWGWAQGTGLVKFDRIASNPNASVVISYKGEIQDLTWSPQGDILYAVENIPQGGKNKVVLWAYHPVDGHVVAQCEKELEGWQEVEALQALPNGNLLFGLHNSKKLLTGTINPNDNCQVSEINEIPVPYDDIEGIALTTCPLTM